MQTSVIRSGGDAEPREPRQDLDQLELVVEVRLEPQDVGAGVRLERPVALGQLLDGAEIGGERAGEEPRPDAPQLVVGDRGHGPLVQRVAPREDRALHARRAQPGHGRVAVGDVQRVRLSGRPSGSPRCHATGMQLGQIGIWRRHQQGAFAAGEIDALGYTALWVGGSPSLAQVRPFLEATSELHRRHRHPQRLAAPPRPTSRPGTRSSRGTSPTASCSGSAWATPRPPATTRGR